MHILTSPDSKFYEVCFVRPWFDVVSDPVYQLYEDDARIGHQEFDLKITSRVKMSMVSFTPSPIVC